MKSFTLMLGGRFGHSKDWAGIGSPCPGVPEQAAKRLVVAPDFGGAVSSAAERTASEISGG